MCYYGQDAESTTQINLVSYLNSKSKVLGSLLHLGSTLLVNTDSAAAQIFMEIPRNMFYLKMSNVALGYSQYAVVVLAFVMDFILISSSCESDFLSLAKWMIVVKSIFCQEKKHMYRVYFYFSLACWRLKNIIYFLSHIGYSCNKTHNCLKCLTFYQTFSGVLLYASSCQYANLCQLGIVTKEC